MEVNLVESVIRDKLSANLAMWGSNIKFPTLPTSVTFSTKTHPGMHQRRKFHQRRRSGLCSISNDLCWIISNLSWGKEKERKKLTTSEGEVGCVQFLMIFVVEIV